MPTENPKRIHLAGSGRHEEIRAGGAITPGDLCARNSSGQAIVHGVGGGAAEKLFALEDALQGNTITDNYASSDLASFVHAQPGDHIYAWLAAGESVDPSDFLSSNGDGTLKEATSTDVRLAAPLETVDNSDSGAVDVRIKVAVL